MRCQMMHLHILVPRLPPRIVLRIRPVNHIKQPPLHPRTHPLQYRLLQQLNQQPPGAISVPRQVPPLRQKPRLGFNIWQAFD